MKLTQPVKLIDLIALKYIKMLCSSLFDHVVNIWQILNPKWRIKESKIIPHLGTKQGEPVLCLVCYLDNTPHLEQLQCQSRHVTFRQLQSCKQGTDVWNRLKEYGRLHFDRRGDPKYNGSGPIYMDSYTYHKVCTSWRSTWSTWRSHCGLNTKYLKGKN